MARKLRVLADMDSIVADFFAGLWRDYEAATGERVATASIASWDMSKYVKDPERLVACFHSPGCFASLDPIPGAIPALQALVAEGHEVVVVSTPCTPHSAAEKISWCAHHLPFLDQRNVWIGHKKHHVRGDVLIDDGPHNISAYGLEHPRALLVGIAYPYNAHAPYHHRVEGHEDFEAAWAQILDRILTYALIDDA